MAQTQRLTNYKSAHWTDDKGVTHVTCHKTEIVRFDNHTITLNSGGWRTKKTSDDMNRASRQFALGYTVCQRRFEWFVRFWRADDNRADIPFEDGMVFDR